MALKRVVRVPEGTAAWEWYQYSGSVDGTGGVYQVLAETHELASAVRAYVRTVKYARGIATTAVSTRPDAARYCYSFSVSGDLAASVLTGLEYWLEVSS